MTEEDHRRELAENLILQNELADLREAFGRLSEAVIKLVGMNEDTADSLCSVDLAGELEDLLAKMPQPGHPSRGLALDGIPVYVSGVAGHFVLADRCQLRLHWRIGDFRISTVGGYRQSDDDMHFTMVGSGRYSETFVFRVEGNTWPEGEAVGSEIASAVADSRHTRSAEDLHYAVARAIAHAVRENRISDAEITAAVKGAA